MGLKGSFVQNVEYVNKDGKLTELGVKPMDNGHKPALLGYSEVKIAFIIAQKEIM